jgi:hypothetical protein
MFNRLKQTPVATTQQLMSSARGTQLTDWDGNENKSESCSPTTPRAPAPITLASRWPRDITDANTTLCSSARPKSKSVPTPLHPGTTSVSERHFLLYYSTPRILYRPSGILSEPSNAEFRRNTF